jgi:hypothetical protein
MVVTNYETKKTGPKKGTTYKAPLDRNHWYNLCRRFVDNKTKYGSKQTNFYGTKTLA